MNKLFRRIFAAMLLMLISVGPAVAQQPTPQPTSQEATQRDEDFEQAIYRRLEQRSPQAVPLFRAATEAMDQEQAEEARL